MVTGDLAILHGIRRDDVPRLWHFNNDLTVELAGGGDPPQRLRHRRLQAEFDREAVTGGRDGAAFSIETDGVCMGSRGLSRFNDMARTAELGFGDRAYWGRGYGREAVRLLLDYAVRYRSLERVSL